MLRECRKCGVTYPLTKENFGHQPNGGYRYSCRACMRKNTSKHYWQDPQRSIDRSNVRASTALSAGEKNSYYAAIMRRDGPACFYCKQLTANVHIDHKEPVSRGGSHSLDNFVIACMPCNQEKHNKTVDEYRVWLQRRGEDVNF
jgi:5-methylcytosine-specific restriction endonuclease McrA